LFYTYEDSITVETNQGDFRWIAFNDYKYMHHVFLLSLAVLQMILQLAVRLKEFHALGNVHRDLKPGHVMWPESLDGHRLWLCVTRGVSSPWAAVDSD
jgi:serine/threonine protein kinase